METLEELKTQISLLEAENKRLKDKSKKETFRGYGGRHIFPTDKISMYPFLQANCGKYNNMLVLLSRIIRSCCFPDRKKAVKHIGPKKEARTEARDQVVKLSDLTDEQYKIHNAAIVEVADILKKYIENSTGDLKGTV